MAKLSVPLLFSALEVVPRRGEPVTVGLPWPRGAVHDEALFQLLNADNVSQPLQTEVLDRWPDGSIRWCLFDFLASWNGNGKESGYTLEIPDTPAQRPALTPASPTPFAMQVAITDSTGAEIGMKLNCDINSTSQLIRIPSIHQGELLGLSLRVVIDYLFPAHAARVTMTLCNPQAADHPAGNWDLGNNGSVFLHGLEIRMDHNCQNGSHRISLERDAPFELVNNILVQQHSSGGENWKSINHISKDRRVPWSRRGYSALMNHENKTGLRSTPIIIAGERSLTMPDFWENFPIGIKADDKTLAIRFLAGFDDLTELQGGEQKTFHFVVGLQHDSITHGTMIWARSPITVSAPPEWYARSGVLPYLTPSIDDPHSAYRALVNQAIDGPDTFNHKREILDEYGWRHFGDIWGDHEAVYHTGPEPMVSHYNNQYDCVLGFLTQYLRSSDIRWLKLGLECAYHTCDIDIYHTTQDKAAYNGGLFWHTYHYAPADTGTHRSYPRSLRNAQHFRTGQDLTKMGETGARLKKNYAIGGGPSAAHNYNHGLMLAYFLTGQQIFRQNAIGLADFVLAMDDGSRTIFRWLSRRDTGLAIQSSEGYLGPGRASGNSLKALLVGHHLTQEPKYLHKAEQIIRRVVHPQQNLESLDLLNVELRWFYTMFLQALGFYLDYKIDRNELDEHYIYARLSLLHYARYMARHERPSLSQPEKLQYPTETWAAQDLRKVEVFQYAAKHASAAERAMFLERAEWFFDYCVKTLDGFSTKSLCRPVVLCMNHGWSRAWWRHHPETTAPEPKVNVSADSFGAWRMYVPQKTVAIRRAKMIIFAAGLLFLLMLVSVIYYAVQ